MSNPAGLTVRPAEPEDVEALASLMTELGYKTSATEMTSRLREIFRDARYRTLVAVRGERVRGMIGTFAHITYEHNEAGGRILALVVAGDARGEGIGRKLIAAAEHDFRERKVTRVALDTRFEREHAHKFYEGLGYAKNGFRLVKKLAESS